MTVWPVQHAKARFSELLDACQREGPQVVSRRGTETAVWCNGGASRPARPSLKELLLAAEARTEALVPPRGQARRRSVLAL